MRRKERKKESPKHELLLTLEIDPDPPHVMSRYYTVNDDASEHDIDKFTSVANYSIFLMNIRRLS